jgi:hypothetical protein
MTGAQLGRLEKIWWRLLFLNLDKPFVHVKLRHMVRRRFGDGEFATRGWGWPSFTWKVGIYPQDIDAFIGAASRYVTVSGIQCSGESSEVRFGPDEPTFE